MKLIIKILVLAFSLHIPALCALRFEGNSEFGKKELSRVCHAAGKGQSCEHAIFDFYRNHGYFGAEIKAVISNDMLDTLFLITEGEPSRITDIDIIVVPDSAGPWLMDLKNHYGGLVASQNVLEEFAGKAIETFIENGRPYARGEWTKFKFHEENDILFEFRIIAGPETIVTGIEYGGIEKTRPELLAKAAGFNPGEKYSESRVRLYKRMIDKLPFVDVYREHKLRSSINGDSTEIILNLKELPSTRVDGAGGLITGGRKTEFIGRLEIEVLNIGGTGRASRLFWNKKDVRSGELQVDYLEPFVLGSRFDLELGIYQVDKDTLFIKTGGSIAFARNLGLDLTGRVDFSVQRTVPESGSEISHSVSRTIGIKFDFDKTDFRPNPVKGYEITSGLVYRYRSNREVQTGQNPPSDLSAVELNIKKYLNLRGKYIFAGGINSWGIASANGIVPVDELKFIGGSNGLRGYIDQLFPSYRHVVFTLEPRIKTGKYSRAYLFGDIGFIKGARGKDIDYKFRPGYGFGLVSATGAGIVRIETGWGEKGFPSEAVIILNISRGF